MLPHMSTTPPTIVVTGGLGYIGSHTALELLRKTGYNVISIDNLANSRPSAEARVAALAGKPYRNYAIDLCDAAATDAVFKANPCIVGVIHFAAHKSVPESVNDPLKYYENNMGALTQVLSACVKYGVRSFIFSSSCTVYGDAPSLPVSEHTPLAEPHSPYGQTKRMGEMMLAGLAASPADINLVSLRYFNPAGADSSALLGEDPINAYPNLVPIITAVAAGRRPSLTVYGTDYATRDGSCVRDYIHVTDLADAHLLALDFLFQGKNTNKYEIFNIGTGSGVTVLEAVAAFEQVSGRNLNYTLGPRRAGDVPAIYSDSTRAHELLRWQPQFTIADMMHTAWQWQQNIETGVVKL